MNAEITPQGSHQRNSEQSRWRMAGWSLAIAATGTPATVAVLFLGQGAEASAAATVIGTITVAALGAARAFGCNSTATDDAPPRTRNTPSQRTRKIVEKE